MKLFLINSNRNASTQSLMMQACKKRGVESIIVNVSSDLSKLPKIEKKDAVYRISTLNKAKIIEQLLIKQNTKTFYQNFLRSQSEIDNVIRASILHQHSEIPMPKTIFNLPQTKSQIKATIKAMGGFPLIIKAAGKSHSIGVMKIDSESSFNSIVDYLNTKENENYIIREFLDIPTSARLIVLGNKVIDSIEYISKEKDFRSNAGEELIVRAKKFSDQVEKTAIKATHAMGVEFGGVDILVDPKNDKHYLLEVNFPCFFPRSQNTTGVDIAGQMVDYLLKKP